MSKSELCVGCGKQSPVVESDHTLISTRFGWRLTRKVSPEGALKVGPRSAGADPGPLCYGRGGADVTVTDAHLVLGRIPPHLLGG